MFEYAYNPLEGVYMCVRDCEKKWPFAAVARITSKKKHPHVTMLRTIPLPRMAESLLFRGMDATTTFNQQVSAPRQSGIHIYPGEKRPTTTCKLFNQGKTAECEAADSNGTHRAAFGQRCLGGRASPKTRSTSLPEEEDRSS